jgi:rhodanese-related sulfurtransferase
VKSKTKLTGRVIFRGDSGYELARKNWDPHTNKFPKVFVFAQRTQDVANAIKWARENNVPIRPRSGRHSLEVNLSQVNGGIVIDVSDMKKIQLNKKNGTVIVETGNRVGRIANTLARQGVSRIAPKSTAFFWRKAKFYVEWNSSWIKQSESAKNIAIVRNTRRKLQPFIVGSYINVPDQGIKNSGPVYYGANFPRLRRVKAKYDPGNVFKNPQSIPPARRGKVN